MNRTVTIPKEHEIESNCFGGNAGESDKNRRAAEADDDISNSRMKAKSTRPRRKRDKNLQVSKDKIPSARDTTSYISSWLMLFNKAVDDADFSRKACESLVKKLKDKNTDSLLRILIQAVATDGRESDPCIPIGRTLDGRLQVASRKGLPHLTYVRIFRNSEAKRTDLRHLPICQCAYDMKQEQYVCVNPWHYEKIVTSIHFQSMSAEKQEEVKEVAKSRESLPTVSKPSSFSSDLLTSSIKPQTSFESAPPPINSYISMNPTTQLTYTDMRSRYEIEGGYQNAFVKPQVPFENELLHLTRDSSKDPYLKKFSDPPKKPELEAYPNLGIFLPNFATPSNMINATPSHYDPFDATTPAAVKTNFPQFDPTVVASTKDLSALSKSAFTSINGNKKPDVNSSLPNVYMNDAPSTSLPRFDTNISRKTSVENRYSTEQILSTSLDKASSLLNFTQIASSKSQPTIPSLTFMGSNEKLISNVEKTGMITMEHLLNSTLKNILLPNLQPEIKQAKVENIALSGVPPKEPAKEVTFQPKIVKAVPPPIDIINLIEPISSDDEEVPIRRDSIASKTTDEDVYKKDKNEDSIDKSVIVLQQGKELEDAGRVAQESIVGRESKQNETGEEKQKNLSEAVDKRKSSKDLDQEANKDRVENKEDSEMKKQLERTISLVYSILRNVGKETQEQPEIAYDTPVAEPEFPSEKVIRITTPKTRSIRKELLKKLSKRKKMTVKGSLKFAQKLKSKNYAKMSKLLKANRKISKFSSGNIEKRRKLGTFTNRMSKYIPGIESFKTLLQQPHYSSTSVPAEAKTRPSSYLTFSRSKPSTSYSGQQTQQMFTQWAVQEKNAANSSNIQQFPSTSMDSQPDTKVADNVQVVEEEHSPVVVEHVENYDISQMEKNMLALSCVSNCLHALREQNILPKPGEKTGNDFLDWFNSHSDALLLDSQNAGTSNELMRKQSDFLSHGRTFDQRFERRDWFRTELLIINESLNKRWQGERSIAKGTTLRLREENADAHMWNIHLPSKISEEMNYIYGKKVRKGKNEYFQSEWAIFKYLQNGNITEQKEAIYNAMFMGVSFSRTNAASQRSSNSCQWKGICGLLAFMGSHDSVWLKNYSCSSTLVHIPSTLTNDNSMKSFKLYPGSRIQIYQHKKSKNKEKSQNSQSTDSIMNTGLIKISYLPGNGQCAHSDDQIHIQITM